MKFGARIFFAYLVIFFLCFSYPINWVVDNLRTRYLEGVEDALVDQANSLAAIIGTQMEAGRFVPRQLDRAFKVLYDRELDAGIYNFTKTDVDMQIYITDAAGKVIFHSKRPNLIGADYYKWRDVALTLKGKYGARTSRSDGEDPAISVLHVAAPVFVDGDIAGVLTVVKPTTNINNFISGAKPRIIRVGILSLAAAVVLGLLVSAWFARPIRRLTQYADDIRRGRRVHMPRLDKTEIGEMGVAFEKMKDALEGKKYVEQYVQKLTHEIKSPLSAIRGAAELLEEEMTTKQRERFLENIQNEVNRIQIFVDRMLALSGIESLKNLEKIESVSLGAVLQSVLESKMSIISQKMITVNRSGEKKIHVKGDSLLLHQAVSNLIANALDFSPPRSTIELQLTADSRTASLVIEDNGSGIPDYAKDRLFDPFFSLKRPGSGKKSTGLGLNIVKEVAALHKGGISLENRSSGGVRAVLTLPLEKKSAGV